MRFSLGVVPQRAWTVQEDTRQEAEAEAKVKKGSGNGAIGGFSHTISQQRNTDAYTKQNWTQGSEEEEKGRAHG